MVYTRFDLVETEKNKISTIVNVPECREDKGMSKKQQNKGILARMARITTTTTKPSSVDDRRSNKSTFAKVHGLLKVSCLRI